MRKNTVPSGYSRRSFLKKAGSAAALGMAVPCFLPSGVLAAPGMPGPNDRVTLGFIGTGGRSRMLMDQIPKDAQIAAISDCFLPRCRETLHLKKRKWDVYQDYRKLLERKDIEAVVVPTTDHTRVLICVHACMAGMDIYAEKPLSITIAEGRVLVKAVRKHRRVFQTGSQQRSMEMNEFACRFVREGGLGKVHTVLATQYPGPTCYVGLPEESIPEGLDWSQWCGQTELRPYNRGLQFGWMRWRAYSGGEMTNWGAHGMDQVQWALGACETGPVSVEPLTEGPNGQVRFLYPGDVKVVLNMTKSPPMGGCVVIGEKGRLRIDRNQFQATPADLIKNGPDAQLAAKWRGNTWPANGHIKDWIMCVKSRKRPVADVEIGHRSISVCHLANIAREVGRKLTWDPVREVFVNDPEASAYLDRPRRKGFELPKI